MHSKLPPSSAYRRVGCPGSRSLEEKYDTKDESPSSLEGIAAHWVATQGLIGIDIRRDLLDGFTPEGELITLEMIEAVEVYVNEIKRVEPDPNKLNIERIQDISSIHPECWGTPDCWTISRDILYLWDFKYGHGFVDVFENYQLLEYAAGIAQNNKFSEICMTIVQPRCYSHASPVRWWSITLDQLVSYISKLQIAESNAMQEGATLNTGLHCMHCKARHVCSALQKSSNLILDLITGIQPNELTSNETGRELGFLYHAQKLLEARITALEEQAKSMIHRGERVTGFKLENSRGRVVWNKDIEEIIELGDCLGINLRKNQEIITPVQAKKLGLSEELIDCYSEYMKGSLKLVVDDEAARIFGK